MSRPMSTTGAPDERRGARAPGCRPLRGGQGGRRPGRRGVRPAGRAAVRRARADGGRPRGRQDPAGAQPRGRAVGADQPGAVHARPDARRHHRLDGHRRRPRRADLPRGSGLHQPAPRRRDQPHPAQDPVGAARGDGGGTGLGGRGLAPPAPAVPGRRDPEPRRVRRHLPPPRGPARPLPAQGRAARARAGRGARDRAPARGRVRPARRGRVRGGGRRRRLRHRGRSPRRGRGPAVSRGRRLRRRRRPGDAAGAVPRAGRQPARRGLPDAYGARLGLARRAATS